MAVGFDASMTSGNGVGGQDQNATGVTTVTNNAVTIGASSTLLVVPITYGSGASTDATVRTCTWNSVAMTEGPTLGVTDGGTHRARVSIFTLVNPATGVNSLTAAWTGACDVYMSSASFTGTDVSTGINAADNITASATTTLSVTSDAAGATLACFAVDGGAPTVNFNKIYSEAPFAPGGGASYQLAGTLNAHTFTLAGGTIQALAGVHIIAPAVSGDTSTPILNFMF